MNLPWSENQWQKSLSQAITDPKELFALLNLDTRLLSDSLLAAKKFKLRVPRGLIARMSKNDSQDPLLLQVLPLGKELVSPADYLADPLHEQANNVLPGLLHKYSNRVLLLVAGACAVNCRYCFRREFDYGGNTPGKEGWTQVFDYIGARPLVEEVILSGGDPLMANNHYLAYLIEKIAEITHVKRIRIHTRLPVVLPERITAGLMTALSSRLKTVVVIHSNHPNELDATVATAMEALQAAGMILFNQSVLLRGINDCATVLRDLSEKLFSMGVLPYYLHLLDKVNGAAHFMVSRKKAIQLAQELAAILPGYLVPRLVEDQVGRASKTLVW